MRAFAAGVCVVSVVSLGAPRPALTQDEDPKAGAIVVEEPDGQTLPGSSDDTRPYDTPAADAPDEFDLRVLSHRVEKSEAIVLRNWEAVIEGRSSGVDPDVLRGLEEQATRLTLETKGLRRQRDELRGRLSRTRTRFRPGMPPEDGFGPPQDFDSGRSSGRRVPTPGPSRDGFDPYSAENLEMIRLREENELLRQQNGLLKELVRKRMASESQGRDEEAPRVPGDDGTAPRE